MERRILSFMVNVIIWGAIFAGIALMIKYPIFIIAIVLFALATTLGESNGALIKVKYFGKCNHRLIKLDKGDWIDLRASETVELKAGEYKMIPLGVGMKLPKDYEAHVLPRSSTFKNYGVIMTNSMGVIDNSYSGDGDEWHFPVYATRDTVIEKGDRICQFRIVKSQPNIMFRTVTNLDNICRGGFGSTGIK